MYSSLPFLFLFFNLSVFLFFVSPLLFLFSFLFSVAFFISTSFLLLSCSPSLSSSFLYHTLLFYFYYPQEIVVGSNMDKIFIVMDYVEHDLKSLMETMKQPFLEGIIIIIVILIIKLCTTKIFTFCHHVHKFIFMDFIFVNLMNFAEVTALENFLTVCSIIEIFCY